MFIQVIEGRAIDAGDLHEALERWVGELSPGAEGWLGTTAGVTDDGLFVNVARFATRLAARRNSDRPEQGQWWVETAKLFAGEVTFLDCEQVVEYLGGGSDEARFVQVLQGRVRDPAQVREVLERGQEELAGFRPDLMGGTAAFYGQGGCVETAYFTSELAARQGEAKLQPPAIRELLREWKELFVSDVDYFDLREPWLYSPR
ncbi:hypothetical protein ACIBI9_57575 [Nonomuraea sp. NPDC050451]|uniref:hypothetical protein n=1 Tax=Nonomuraea sp. NPDC050451 TaxID=3364364 RepID=UPI0037AE038B